MRIAVSGSHATGKTTLIEAFVARHRRFAYEPEPYAILQEPYGGDFERQLEIHMESLAQYATDSDVIFERCAADFLAYMLVAGSADEQVWVEHARRAMARLDVIVFLPIDERVAIDVGEDEDPELRAAVDERLQDILLDDEFDLFSDSRPLLVEARGSVEQRIQTMEKVMRR